MIRAIGRQLKIFDTKIMRREPEKSGTPIKKICSMEFKTSNRFGSLQWQLVWTLNNYDYCPRQDHEYYLCGKCLQLKFCVRTTTHFAWAWGLRTPYEILSLPCLVQRGRWGVVSSWQVETASNFNAIDAKDICFGNSFVPSRGFVLIILLRRYNRAFSLSLSIHYETLSLTHLGGERLTGRCGV